MLNLEEVVVSSFKDFCGSIFWNDSLTWDTGKTGNDSLPDFTKCFQQTVTTWVPCGFLWLMFPFYVCYLSRVNSELKQNLTRLSAAKSVIAVLLASVSLFELAYTIAMRTYSDDKDSFFYLPTATYVSTSVNVCSMILAACLVQYYRVRGQFTSAILWIYWCLWFLGSAVPLYSFIVHAVDDGKVDNVAEFTIAIINFTLITLEVILSCISDANAETRERFRNTCPEFLGSFSSYLTYDWLTSTVVLGYKKGLEKEDMWELGPRDRSSGHVPAFEADWKKAVEKWRQQ